MTCYSWTWENDICSLAFIQPTTCVNVWIKMYALVHFNAMLVKYNSFFFNINGVYAFEFQMFPITQSFLLYIISLETLLKYNCFIFVFYFFLCYFIVISEKLLMKNICRLLYKNILKYSFV